VEQSDLLRFIVRLLEQLDVPYAIVGSFASGAYGEPRFTQDIDLVVELTPAQVDAVISHLPEDDFYVSCEAALEALRTGGQFKVIHPESGNKVDFIIARRDAWGQQQLQGRKRLELLSGVEAYAARPEDVILGKLLYYHEGGSEKHLRDITGILKLNSDAIDRDYVRQWAQQLGVEEIWQAILARLGQ